MKFLVACMAAAFAGFVSGEEGGLEAAVACPTITQSIVNPACSQACDNNCQLVSTVTNPCGCPSAVAVATLVAPCGGGCPYAGCKPVFPTKQEACWPPPWPPRPTSPTTTTTPTTTPRPTTPTTTSRPTTPTTTTTSRPVIITSVTQLPPRPPTTTPCPTVTRTTRPANCEPIRCPVPGCTEQTSIVVPCGCAEPSTVLKVEGCQTACPTDECATRTRTSSVLCSTTA